MGDLLDELGALRDFLEHLTQAIGQTYKKVNIGCNAIDSVDLDNLRLDRPPLTSVSVATKLPNRGLASPVDHWERAF